LGIGQCEKGKRFLPLRNIDVNVYVHYLTLRAKKGKKGKAVPLHAMEALGGEEV
jgi:hypothetical protein